MCLAGGLASLRRGRGRAYVLGVLFALLILVPLAHIRPPDAMWIAGIYDAADGDDAVSLLTDTVGSVDGDFYKSLSLPCLHTNLMDLYRPVYLSPLSLRRDRGPPVTRRMVQRAFLPARPTSPC